MARWLIFAFVSFFVVHPVGAASIPDVVLHLATNGDDHNDGSLARPILSLKRANQLLSRSNPSSRVQVRIAPGIYRNQWVEWNWAPGSPIEIGPEPGAARPVFAGDNTAAWFTLAVAPGRPTRVTIEGLRIQGYRGAIWLKGDRERADGWNGGNAIRNNDFVDIGSIDPTGKIVATFAVELVNSRDNVIEHNHFKNIVSRLGCNNLHSIYMSNFSSKNVVKNNSFDGGCGATISLRDGSNDNMFKSNVFRNQRVKEVFLEWSCDPAESHCTKLTQECPSWGNRVIGSVMKPVSGINPKFIHVYNDRVPKGCRDLRMPRVTTTRR
jgi:hypothetical protein